MTTGTRGVPLRGCRIRCVRGGLRPVRGGPLSHVWKI